jgi:hypothetical protein
VLTAQRGRPVICRSWYTLLAASCATANALAATPAEGYLLLPRARESMEFQYSEVIGDGMTVQTRSGTVTISTSPAGNVVVAVSSGKPLMRRFALRFTPKGTLAPLPLPPLTGPDPGRSEERRARALHGFRQRLIDQLAMAARIGAAGESTVMRLDVPQATSHVSATLFIQRQGHGHFTGRAAATTFVGESHRSGALLPVGAGLLAAGFAGVAGRIIGGLVAAGSAVLAAREGAPRPAPADVSLIIQGRADHARLQQIAVDQEVIVYGRRRLRTYSDRWSLSRLSPQRANTRTGTGAAVLARQ